MTAKFPMFRDVTKALDGVREETRTMVLSRWSGDRDRWNRRDWVNMAHALTMAEDELELARGSHAAADRVRLRVLRRMLEAELA